MNVAKREASEGTRARTHMAFVSPIASAIHPERAVPSPPVPKPSPRMSPEARPRCPGRSPWATITVTEKEQRRAAPDAATRNQIQIPFPESIREANKG